MKKLAQRFAVVLLLILISCGQEKTATNNSEINSYLNDLSNIKQIEKTPIQTLTILAKEHASKSISIKKGNIKAALENAQNFKHALLLVSNHTVVKITSYKDCLQSGAWGTCMPMAEGFIKKGTLNYKKDYINNIIGLPDNQERTLYLFN